MNSKKPIIIAAHIIIILLAYTAPFWLDWKLVLVGVILNYIQILIFKGCVLSHAQFEDKKQSFHEWYLRKLGFKPSRRVLNFALRGIIPFVLLGLALLFQVLLKVNVLVSLS
jgi:putative flippase GtrA